MRSIIQARSPSILGSAERWQILEISLERIRDYQIGEDRDVALLAGKGDALCDLRPDIDPGRGSSLHVRFRASEQAVGGACTYLGIFGQFLLIRNGFRVEVNSQQRNSLGAVSVW
jgi:hypothetical protein